MNFVIHIVYVRTYDIYVLELNIINRIAEKTNFK